MLGNHFYHSAIRNITAVFGTLFNNIHVVRTVGGQVVNQEKVRLAFSPKQKFLARLQAQPDLKGTKRAVHLPGMGFEITAITYDTERQLNKNNFCPVDSTDNSKRIKVHNPVPYIISYQLTIIAKTEEDVFQILEQILPTFAPAFTVDTIPIPAHPDIKDKMRFKLTSVSPSDDYEGDFQTRRAIVYSLDFDVHVNLFGEIDKDGGEKVIKTATVTFHDYDDSTKTLGSISYAVTPSFAEVDNIHTIEITENWDE